MQDNNPDVFENSQSTQVENKAADRALHVILATLLVIFAMSTAFLYWQNKSLTEEMKIGSYVECTNADGSVIQESYPEICVTKMGRRFVNEEAVIETHKPDLNPTPSPQATSSAITNWKTESYNKLSLRYPFDWKSESAFVPIETLNLYPIVSGDFASEYVSIYALDNPNKLSVPDFFSRLDGAKPPHYSSNSTLLIQNGIQGYYQEDANCEPLACDTYVFTNDDKIYFSALIYPSAVASEPVAGGPRDIFTQILSTFEFTE